MPPPSNFALSEHSKAATNNEKYITDNEDEEEKKGSGTPGRNVAGSLNPDRITSGQSAPASSLITILPGSMPGSQPQAVESTLGHDDQMILAGAGQVRTAAEVTNAALILPLGSAELPK